MQEKVSRFSFWGKSDYSGYERDTWQIREQREHIEQVKIVEEATTVTDKRKMVKIWGSILGTFKATIH